MGQFSDLINQKSAEAVINQSIKDISEELGKVDKRLEKLETDFLVGIQVGQNASAQKYALASAILKMSAAPACFIPFCGPIVGTVLAGVGAYIAPDNTSMNLGAGVIEASNRANLNTFNNDKNPNPLLNLMSGGVDKNGAPNNPYLSESVGKVVWLYGNASDTAINLAKDGLNVGNFMAKVEIIGKLDAAKEARNYQMAIEENVKETVESMHQNQATFLPIIFWKLCESKDIKGHGTTLMNSLDLREGKDFDGWVKIEDAKTMLSGNHVDNKVLGEFANQTWGSKYRGLAKKEFRGIDTYKRLLNDAEGRAVTPIYIEKLRLFAYRQRFSEALKSDIGNNFLMSINKYDNSPNKLLPKNFYASSLKHKITDCDSKTNISSKSVHNADQFRRREIYSWYCFHQILRIHLGTFILSSLPTLGTDPSADIRVMFAIIDATATAWWATTRAFNAGGRVVYDEDLDSFRIRSTTLKKLPYIENYFKPENIFYNLLIQHPEMQGNFNQAKTRIEESLENIKALLAEGENRISINRLMPGNNNDNIIGLENWSVTYINRLYHDLADNMQTAYDRAMERITNQASKVQTYNKDFSDKYDQISSTTSDDLKRKYMRLADPDNEFADLQPLFEDVKINNEFVENVANVHMGSLVSASSSNGISQAEFNRSIARAFKSLVIHMGKKGLL